MTFETWKDSVNDSLRHLTGLECDDVADMNYYCDFEAGLTPRRMMDKILKFNGYKRSDF